MLKFFLSLSIFSSVMMADEPVLMELLKIYDNGNYLLRYKQDTFLCRPYGIIPLDKLLYDTKLNGTCKNAIEEFIVSNPLLTFYSQRKLHLRQLYHIEFHQQHCIIYVQGRSSLGKLLLQQGIAIVDPKLKDEILEYRYKKAQQSAIDAKKGLWQNYKVKTCVSQMLKE